MDISDGKKISEVKKEFHDKFPFLKLEFYKEHHKVGEGSSAKQLLEGDKTIGEVRSIHNSGEISINGNLKVSSLEQAFSDTYGLNVQVFRKSGKIWLQTITTDEWTLSEQNHKGEEMTKSRF